MDFTTGDKELTLDGMLLGLLTDACFAQRDSLYARHLPGDEEVLQLHQFFDGQPTFDPGRPGDFQCASTALRPSYP